MHSLVPDGVFERLEDGRAVFRALPPPRDEDVERLVCQIRRAVDRCLVLWDEWHDEDDDHEARHIRAAAAATPQRPGGVSVLPSPRSAFVMGYSLHADRCVEQGDREALERLCRYGARSPIALSRLSISATGQVVMGLKRPLRTGQTELVFSPEEFLRRLAALIPPRRTNLTRYHGVFAPNHPLRSSVVPAQVVERPIKRKYALPWAELLRRVFAVDVLKCEACNGEMRIIAVLPESPITVKILEHLGLPTEPPRPRATAPPPAARGWIDDAWSGP